jgi:hypothetical protein
MLYKEIWASFWNFGAEPKHRRLRGERETVRAFGWCRGIDKYYTSLWLNWLRDAWLFSFCAILTGRTPFALLGC